MNSTKIKKLEKWREEYLQIRRQIFCFDEDEDVFSLFKLNSKDLKYKGIIRRLQIEFNEDNFNRDLEKNEMLTQIQVIKREQGRILRKMDENWQNPKMMNYLRGESAKLIEKQNDFKNFHGQNFNFIEEEKEALINELNQFNIDAYGDINYQQPQSRQSQNQSASPQQIDDRKKLESDYIKKSKNKSKRKRKEFKSQEGLSDMMLGQDTSKKSSSDNEEDDTLLQKSMSPNQRKKKHRQLSIEQDQNFDDQEEDEDLDKNNDDRPTQADIFVTQDKLKKENPNQYLSKVSELPEEESKQMTQKLNSNILASNHSKGKSNFVSPRSEKNNKAAIDSILNHANSEFVDAEEVQQLQDSQDEMEHKYQNQQKNNYFYSPQKNKNKQLTHQQYLNQYNTPKPTRKHSNSPNKISEESSIENYRQNHQRINLNSQQQNNQASRSYSPQGQNSKQNISLLDKSLNNISNIEEDQKDMQQIKDFVKRIDGLIEDLGGSNCGWSEQDHRSFLYLMKKYGNNGLRTKEALCDANISVLQFYTDKQLLDHINSYNQYKLLMEQKQKYIEEYKEITQRIEKRKQMELQILKNARKEREFSQLKQRIHSTVQRTEFYVKQFEEIKKKYKDVEAKSSHEYQIRQKQREKEVYDMVQRRQKQKEMLQAISSKKSQQEIKKVNMLKEQSQKEKIQSLIPQNQSLISSPQNQIHQEKIANIQKDLMMKMQQLEELRMQSKSKKINQYIYFTPQINKKYFSPNRVKIDQIY
ncbi:hypothetical protein TTHERM_00194730 (macronuclear) [Tetrahymena thermophila SB210]|uniref:Uncharacterized protein n=1 Tax=Tetrahymena thermophila (strain SB210) TaxID=312017 RepID=Q23K62_TETTS|nr:hypothetical protein TTHERM_00194730 [Tetrahymena thermophila SB210]EAR96981.1 hypothetical protein TTHERM_00194730 [Tetrahymena thermophila SB210]|eukprot:XP_001017226.1 hypothetical protein TTHERM_00194730 [Tetrahymena thermophila SB210]